MTDETLKYYIALQEKFRERMGMAHINQFTKGFSSEIEWRG